MAGRDQRIKNYRAWAAGPWSAFVLLAGGRRAKGVFFIFCFFFVLAWLAWFAVMAVAVLVVVVARDGRMAIRGGRRGSRSEKGRDGPPMSKVIICAANQPFLARWALGP